MKDETKRDPDGMEDIGSLAGFFAPSWARDDNQSSAVKLVSQRGEPSRYAPARDGRDGRRFPGRDGGKRDGEAPKGQRRDGDFRRKNQLPPKEAKPRESVSREEPLDLSVRFLPAGAALDAIIHRVKHSHMAFPFKDIVNLFRKDDASLSVRIENAENAPPGRMLFQCSKCMMPALSARELEAHVLECHFSDHFTSKVVEEDPPKGNFTCVARYAPSGELIAPPNHHSYSRRVDELSKKHGLSRERFESGIETVRDPALVEIWRDEARKTVRYFIKDGDETAGLSRADAELRFTREILPGYVQSLTRVVCPATILKNMPNRRLASFLNAEFAKDSDQKFKGSLFRALHAAFHRHDLHFFRINNDQGQEFVAAKAPVALGDVNLVPEMEAVLSYVKEHPCVSEKALVAEFAPEGDEAKAKEIHSHIRFLSEKGAIVEFFNRTFSPAAAHPVFKPQQKKQKQEGKDAAPQEAAGEARKEDVPDDISSDQAKGEENEKNN